jgi:hypothetical protein
MSAIYIIANVGYYRRCRLYCCSCLLNEFDAAGHTDALEIPLLLSSDAIVADVELNQRPIVGKDIR